eukprot:TRINITY_DN11587_c0_g1_i5.p1 TRINITY_DN11587_c0_g1~~TRINITY_DN11587_c0_g1_i5.p1  ORF type:complete len:262 (+),score=30.94 TRINITY_DN11587_c0_g1_i5:27-788(+)
MAVVVAHSSFKTVFIAIGSYVLALDERSKGVHEVAHFEQEAVPCAAAMSKNGSSIAIAYSNKTMMSWRIITNDANVSLGQQREYKIERKATSVVFSCWEGREQMFLADKFGDVYRFETEGDQLTGTPLCGSVSMLMALAVTSDDKHIVIADRDFKLRISSLPATYAIQAYCLGHEEYLSSVTTVQHQGQELLLSTSGDGTVRLWDLTGQQLDCWILCMSLFLLVSNSLMQQCLLLYLSINCCISLSIAVNLHA